MTTSARARTCGRWVTTSAVSAGAGPAGHPTAGSRSRRRARSTGRRPRGARAGAPAPGRAPARCTWPPGEPDPAGAHERCPGPSGMAARSGPRQARRPRRPGRRGQAEQDGRRRALGEQPWHLGHVRRPGAARARRTGSSTSSPSQRTTPVVAGRGRAGPAAASTSRADRAGHDDELPGADVEVDVTSMPGPSEVHAVAAVTTRPSRRSGRGAPAAAPRHAQRRRPRGGGRGPSAPTRSSGRGAGSSSARRSNDTSACRWYDDRRPAQRGRLASTATRW